MTGRILFHQKFPWKAGWSRDCVVVHDRVLMRQPAAARWLRRFPARYAVTAGEGLKDVRAFAGHIEAIARLSGSMANRRLTIVVAGGGSVGDFGGFVASVYKRGVKLVNVPTTWLAAVDSAYGGKTGLNLGGVKNQIGTFYPASETHVVREVLAAQPPVRATEAAAEILKMSLLRGGRLEKRRWTGKDLASSIWAALPDAIEGKLSIVRKDPLEKTGVRHLLNLGHTMGHVFEAELKLPHGTAVGYGLAFAVAYSRSAGVCSAAAYERKIRHPLWNAILPAREYLDCLSIPPARLRRLLLQDKKRTAGSSLRFVFLKGVGSPLIREVPVGDLIAEAARQRASLRRLYG